MKTYWILLTVLLIIESSYSRKPKKTVAKTERDPELPFVAAIICETEDGGAPIVWAGSIIKENFVLTSARHFRVIYKPFSVHCCVQTAASSPGKPPYRSKIRSVTVHEEFDPNNIEYGFDIAIVHAVKLSLCSSRTAIALTNEVSDWPKDIALGGWIKCKSINNKCEDDDSKSKEKKDCDLKYNPGLKARQLNGTYQTKECFKAIRLGGKPYSSRLFCGQNKENALTESDDGGPVFTDSDCGGQVLIGIISFGPRDSGAKQTYCRDFYTIVAYYRKWIKENTIEVPDKVEREKEEKCEDIEDKSDNQKEESDNKSDESNNEDDVCEDENEKPKNKKDKGKNKNKKFKNKKDKDRKKEDESDEEMVDDSCDDNVDEEKPVKKERKGEYIEDSKEHRMKSELLKGGLAKSDSIVKTKEPESEVKDMEVKTNNVLGLDHLNNIENSTGPINIPAVEKYQSTVVTVDFTHLEDNKTVIPIVTTKVNV